jgi:hypothetical protein
MMQMKLGATQGKEQEGQGKNGRNASIVGKGNFMEGKVASCGLE